MHEYKDADVVGNAAQHLHGPVDEQQDGHRKLHGKVHQGPCRNEKHRNNAGRGYIDG